MNTFFVFTLGERGCDANFLYSVNDDDNRNESLRERQSNDHHLRHQFSQSVLQDRKFLQHSQKTQETDVTSRFEQMKTTGERTVLKQIA